MSSDIWLLYGANGYTGSLIARTAVQQGLRPILAGRRPARITPLTAVGIARKVLAGLALVGFQTPSRAYGADLLEFEGVVRPDE